MKDPIDIIYKMVNNKKNKKLDVVANIKIKKETKKKRIQRINY